MASAIEEAKALEPRDAGSYSSVELATEVFSARVFLPAKSPEDAAYYKGTRFDWSTQIGSVTVGPHLAFGHDFWRGLPHDASSSEGGVGLACEFGSGDFGAFCAKGDLNYDAGAQNGLLGFDEAKEGDAFVKIGVGKLVKDAEAVWNLFGTYAFAEHPVWDVKVEGKSSVSMSQEVVLNEKWGYRLQTKISAEGSTLKIETTLTNLGSEKIVTPHYSHNFLSVDRRGIGPPWKLSMVPDATSFMEPGAGTWAAPILDYFTAAGDAMEAHKEVPEVLKLKCNFNGEKNVDAANWWVATHDNLRITSRQTNDLAKLYAYNLFVEKETLSPEPIAMLEAEPGKSTSWTRTLDFELQSNGSS